MIIDSHSHIHDEKFAEDLDVVLERARLAQISHLITIGCDVKTTRRAQEMAHKFEHVFFTAGYHPHEAKLLDDKTFVELKKLANDPKCVAIGECGLDFFYLHSSIEEQKRAFKMQLLLAEELDLCIVVHLRDAFADCIALLKEHEKLLSRVVIHCFSGNLDEAKIFAQMGCLISLSGIITFKKPGELPLVAKNIALEHLLVETDCPYLAPHPYRGKRNEPAYIVYTLEAIAAARNEDIKKVSEQIYKNSINFFRLPVR